MRDLRDLESFLRVVHIVALIFKNILQGGYRMWLEECNLQYKWLSRGLRDAKIYCVSSTERNLIWRYIPIPHYLHHAFVLWFSNHGCLTEE
jgi:hypothetical protein